MSWKPEGVYTAFITPFVNGEVDYEALEALIDMNIAAGVTGFSPLGSSAETQTLTEEEKEKIVKLCVKKAEGKFKVIVGTGSNNTKAAVEATRKAKEWGADAVLIVTPYYNKPSQEGILLHLKEIDKVGLPIILYNNPGRSVVNMSPETIAEIYHQCNNVVGIKECSGTLEHSIAIQCLCDIPLLTGDDIFAMPLMSIGGKGAITVMPNIIPHALMDMCNGNDLKKGHAALKANYPLLKVLMIETNPVAVKYAMFKMGLIKSPEVRLPLCELSSENKLKVEAVLKQRNMI